MTKKDYQLIANALNILLLTDTGAEWDQWRNTVDVIATALASDNPAFDRDYRM